MTACGFKWNAPYLHPPDFYGRIWQGTMPQVCALKKDHEPPHVSATKVIHNPKLIAPAGWRP